MERALVALGAFLADRLGDVVRSVDQQLRVPAEEHEVAHDRPGAPLVGLEGAPQEAGRSLAAALRHRPEDERLHVVGSDPERPVEVVAGVAVLRKEVAVARPEDEGLGLGLAARELDRVVEVAPPDLVEAAVLVGRGELAAGVPPEDEEPDADPGALEDRARVVRRELDGAVRRGESRPRVRVGAARSLLVPHLAQGPRDDAGGVPARGEDPCDERLRRGRVLARDRGAGALERVLRPSVELVERGLREEPARPLRVLRREPLQCLARAAFRHGSRREERLGLDAPRLELLGRSERRREERPRVLGRRRDAEAPEEEASVGELDGRVALRRRVEAVPDLEGVAPPLARRRLGRAQLLLELATPRLLELGLGLDALLLLLHGLAPLELLLGAGVDELRDPGRESGDDHDPAEEHPRRGKRARGQRKRPRPAEPAVEVVPHVARCRVARAARERERLVRDRLEPGGHVRRRLAERGARALDDHLPEVDRRAGLEGPLPREALEEDDAERVDVGAPVHVVLGADLLRGHVVGGADRVAGARQAVRGALVPREPEVRDARPPALPALVGAGEDQVRGLEVAVDDARAVRGVHGVGDLAQELRRVPRREPAVAQPLLERGPGAVLHGVEEAPAVLSPVEDAHEPRVVEPRGDRNLPLEAREERGVVVDRGLDHDLEGVEAALPLLAREVDDPHGAAPEDLVQLVGAEPGRLSGGRRVRDEGRRGRGRRHRGARGGRARHAALERGVRDRLERDAAVSARERREPRERGEAPLDAARGAAERRARDLLLELGRARLRERSGPDERRDERPGLPARAPERGGVEEAPPPCEGRESLVLDGGHGLIVAPLAGENTHTPPARRRCRPGSSPGQTSTELRAPIGTLSRSTG